MSYSSIAGFLVGLGVFLFVFAAVALVFYFVFAFGQYRVLKAMGNELAWMSFIPVLQIIVLAKYADDGAGKAHPFGLSISTEIFQFWYLLYILLLNVPEVGSLLGFVLYGICLAESLKKIYAMCEGRAESEVKSIAYVSGFIPLVMYIKFLAYNVESIKNNMFKQSDVDNTGEWIGKDDTREL